MAALGTFDKAGTTSAPAATETTAEKLARQARAWARRYNDPTDDVLVNTTEKAPTPTTYGAKTTSSGPSAAQIAASQAAAAAAAANRAANNSAKSSANSTKTALQQAIDAAFSQRATNTAKLDALTDLVGGGLQSARDSKLSAVSSDLKTLLDASLKEYDLSKGDLNTALRSNEMAEADSSFNNLANRGREKQDVVSQALSQGAGESDVLRAQLQTLRNWSSNQADVNRSYFDTENSANSALTSLGTSIKSNMTGYEIDANQRRSSTWDDFYNAMADSYTQKDNLASSNYLLDQEIGANQAKMKSQDALLSWLGSGKNASDYVEKTTATGKESDRKAYSGFADKAAEYAGKSWESPGVSDATKNFEGQKAVDTVLSSSQPWNAQTATASKGPAAKKRPEGATLRRW